MKISCTKYLIFLLFLASCGNEEKEIKNYGFLSSKSKALNVPIKLSEFADFGFFLDRIREITCNDSIARLEIKVNNTIRNIYPFEDCNPPKFNPKSKQYITFRNGKAYQYRSNIQLNLDLLNSKFKKDFAFFKNLNESDIPDYFLVIIESERNEKVNGIENLIVKITNAFDELNTEIPFDIMFWKIPLEMPQPPRFENDDKGL